MNQKIVAIVIRQNGAGEYTINGKVSIKVKDGDMVIKMGKNTKCHKSAPESRRPNRVFKR